MLALEMKADSVTGCFHRLSLMFQLAKPLKTSLATPMCLFFLFLAVCRLGKPPFHNSVQIAGHWPLMMRWISFFWILKASGILKNPKAGGFQGVYTF